MAILEALRAGRHGVRLEVPATWQVKDDGDDAATLIDTDQGVQWNLFYFPAAPYDLSDAGWPSLQRDVRQHADYVFDVMRRKAQAELEPGETLPPKPPRHPLISCDRVPIDGGTAVRILHRMVMQPGLEIVMGHLLVPTAEGLFEARWITRNAGPTGMRESVLLMKAMDTRPGEAPDALMMSIDYDSPSHDADFPDHPLSLARACARTVEAAVHLQQPPAPVRSGEHELRSLAIAFTPPPRFARMSESSKSSLYRRYSLAGNDGTQILGVELAPIKTDLEQLARTLARSIGVAPGPVRREGDLFVCDGTRDLDEARIVITQAALDASRQLLLQLVTTTSFPLDDIGAELTSAARSVRTLPKPWWKLW